MAEMGLRWWRRFAARTRMEDIDVKIRQQADRQACKGTLTQNRYGKSCSHPIIITAEDNVI